MQTVWQQRLSQQHKHRPNDNRSPWQVDRSRIIHAAAFRRLQAKTQIMSIGVNDFYRTRLTHSLEVSQIGSGLLRHLKIQNPEFLHFPSTSLIETLCLAHDIGHPPFGHGGETALNYLMKDNGGFEGNAQTLRIVSKLEPYSKGFGMNLTRRTLLGFVKYPGIIDTMWFNKPIHDTNQRFIKANDWLPVKGVYRCDQDVFDWIISPFSATDQSLLQQHQAIDKYRCKTQFKSLDCAIMELADDIAYAVHDLEDAIATDTLTHADWTQYAEPKLAALCSPWLKQNLPQLTQRLFSRDEALRKDAIGELVNLFIVHSALATQSPDFESPLLRYSVTLEAEFAQILSILKVFVFERLIREPKMQQIEFSGQNLLIDLFRALASDPMRLLPYTAQEQYQLAQTENMQMRILADYLSAMTDEHARRTHKRLFASE
ncbi:Deoxyguanosinetriphosphate triphosphohydrolase-like protein [Pseudoalteromonas holothuriae]|uniref:Deoxyguanosinetriphosphate triphosphohydrolase-like protein n=1 Tax=Pseudoalteromonas holothuriae TaxID=2963714 RepID=A0A9W4W4F3_9GAMM|nr:MULTISPECIES: anti-phage deoxyguanosine triphosphatase [unclassified Pseudoalteromonas]CAH9057825.1 Deoxyguanosinetriphosphate triphosphohydrolase-like protein [Pseudoalteromonas sp. CIP111951]CAH9058863.1 Deoxyguanosinetriphosphate triphosphohydrolase-like protein [Pseudoalteromonas sp. CIP111854]